MSAGRCCIQFIVKLFQDHNEAIIEDMAVGVFQRIRAHARTEFFQDVIGPLVSDPDGDPKRLCGARRVLPRSGGCVVFEVRQRRGMGTD